MRVVREVTQGSDNGMESFVLKVLKIGISVYIGLFLPYFSCQGKKQASMCFLTD
jgi:hypothetical protein